MTNYFETKRTKSLEMSFILAILYRYN